MGKNFWKTATIGLAGYIIGREHRTYTGPVRYNYGMSQNRSKSFISTYAKALGKNICKYIIGHKDSDGLSDVAKRALRLEFKTKNNAHSAIDWLKENGSIYGTVTVSDYLKYLQEHFYMLADTDYTKFVYDLTSHYIDSCYGWTYPFEAFPVPEPNGSWRITLPPVQCLKKKGE